MLIVWYNTLYAHINPSFLLCQNHCVQTTVPHSDLSHLNVKVWHVTSLWSDMKFGRPSVFRHVCLWLWSCPHPPSKRGSAGFYLESHTEAPALSWAHIPPFSIYTIRRADRAERNDVKIHLICSEAGFLFCF